MREYTLFLKSKFISILFLLFIVVTSIPFQSFSNNLISFSNIDITVVDGTTNEPMIGVSVFADDVSKFAGTTNFEGKITLKNLGHRDYVNFSYIGYSSLRLPLYQIRNAKRIVRIYESSEELDEIIVVGRKDEAENEMPYAISKISKAEISFVNSQTSADALSNSGDVYVQKSQMGGGSPILRGFEANRVLLVIDGVRMNNAIYRSGHLQNSISIDNSMLEQIEVIHGPGSLTYGSDALGGVVHFRTKDPQIILGDFGKKYLLESNAFIRYASANDEKTLHFDVDYGTKKWGSLTSFSYSDYGDLRAGSKRPEGYPNFGKRNFYQVRTDGKDYVHPNPNPNLQIGTAFNQIDFTQKIRYQPSDSLYFVLNLQYSTSSDVPRYDNLTDTLSNDGELDFIEWYYGPQQRIMASLKTKIMKPTFLYDKGNVIAAFQRIDEDRLSRKFNKIQRKYNLEDVYVYSLTLDFDKYLGKKQRNIFAYGLEGSYNNVISTAGKIDIYKEEVVLDVPTRYPSGGSSMATAAGYANYKWKSRDSTFIFQAGARYSYVRINAIYSKSDSVDWPSNYYDGIQIENKALTWAAGITWNSKKKWQIRLLASTAFRSPNIDDFGKIRIQNRRIIVPNTELTPEESLNGEITIAKEFGRMNNKGKGATFKLSGTGFYTQLTNAIIRLDSTFNGSPTLVVDGQPHEVQKNVNAQEAIIYGFSGNALLKINSTWQLKSSINYTKGQTVISPDSLTAFAHIPPIYGMTSLSFKTEKFRLDGIVRYNGAKPITDYDPGKKGNYEGTSDNAEQGLIDAEGNYQGLAAWTTYNLYATYSFNEKHSLSLNVENITDVHYRHFGSGISAAGRNFILSFRKKF